MKARIVIHAVHAAVALIALAASQGCENRNEPPSTTGKTSDGNATTSKPAAPDNTARNAGDAKGSPTAQTQGESESDRRITADVRKAIVADSTLSMDAHNCKVITNQGVVTLRGPVKSQSEKDAIGAMAKSVAGVTEVVNQLEVKG